MPAEGECDIRLPLLPAELTDQIIDFLWFEDKALQACSLVCRQWLPRSRYHLFHILHFYGSDVKREVRAQKLVEVAPVLGPYVRSLEAYDYTRIASITTHLVNLNHAAVHDIDHPHLIHLLSACPALKSLELNYSNLTGFSEVHVSAQEDALAGMIKTLKLYMIHSGLSEFLRWAMSNNVFSRIRTIKCWTASEPETTFSHRVFPLMRHYGANLVHVSIADLPFGCTDLFLEALTEFENLEKLFIEPRLSQLEELHQRAWLLDTIPLIFDQICSDKMTCISLRLKFNASLLASRADFEERFNDMWTGVSRTLASPQFERCTVGLNFEIGSGWTHPDYIKFTSLLPWKGGKSSWRDYVPTWAIERHELPILSSNSSNQT